MAKKLEGYYSEDAQDQSRQEPPSQEIPQKPDEFQFLSLLKNQIRVDKKLEIQKEILSSNFSFSASEAFRMFDQDNKGYITEQDFVQKFAEIEL